MYQVKYAYFVPDVPDEKMSHSFTAAVVGCRCLRSRSCCLSALDQKWLSTALVPYTPYLSYPGRLGWFRPSGLPYLRVPYGVT